MAIIATTGKPSTGMSMDYLISHCARCGQPRKSVPGAVTGKPYYYPHSAADCTPPAENSNPSGASEGADGQGACTPKRSNLDNTRRRSVVKGCKVRFPGGAVATVARVRLGEFWTTTGAVKPWPTEFVWVVP